MIFSTISKTPVMSFTCNLEKFLVNLPSRIRVDLPIEFADEVAALCPGVDSKQPILVAGVRGMFEDKYVYQGDRHWTLY